MIKSLRMSITPENKKKLLELRKIERQAKQLIFKMKRLEENWKQLRLDLKEAGKNLPQGLGDILANWNRIT